MITLQQVQDLAREVATEFPDRVNPRSRDGNGGGCVYTDRADPDWHCLGGEILVRLDLPLPDNALRVMSVDPHGEIFRPDAMTFLRALQDVADSGHSPRVYSSDVGSGYRYDVTWREAYALACQARGLTP